MALSNHRDEVRRTSRATLRQAALFRRLIWNVVPAAAVIGVVGLAILGDEGLLARHALKQRLALTEEHARELEQQNAMLRAQIERMRNDPLVVQRTVAETLYVAPAGATIYRFE
jgi:cell division protein FtsB